MADPDRMPGGTGVLDTIDRRLLRMDTRDNVVIALEPLRRGETVSTDQGPVELVTDVPAKHKFMLESRSVGEEVRMYGIIVGKATKPIARGEIVTTMNLAHATSGFHEKSGAYSWTAPNVSRWRSRTFLGYRRYDGQVGTRNYWLVVPLVFCENRNIGALKEAFEEELGFAAPQPYRQFVADLVRERQKGSSAPLPGQGPARPASSQVFPNVDGIKFLLHQEIGR